MLNRLNKKLIFIAALLFVGLVFVAPKAYAVQKAYAQYPGLGDPGVRSVGGGSGGLVPVQPEVDGGVIPTGATSQVVVRFRNEGSQPVETGIIRLYPSSTVSAETTMNQCRNGALESGAECAIALTVKALQVGAWRVEMLMSHSGRTRLVTATLSGQVESAGEGGETVSSDVEMIPDELDFGDVDAAQPLVEPVILKNITSIPINIDDIYIDASESSGYELATDCDSLDPGQACIATISWSPKVRGASSGVLVVKHTGPTGLSSVVVRGEYNPSSVDEVDVFPEAIPGKGLLVSSQTEFDFGEGVSTTSTMTVSLVNAGDSAVTLKDIRISGSDNGLNFREGGCRNGMILNPVEACPLTLNWSPSRSGAILDDIQIVHDGARGVLVLPVRGEADAAVSQDQKAIVLEQRPILLDGSAGAQDEQEPVITQFDDSQAAPVQKNQQAASRQRQGIQEASYNSYSAGSVANPASVLDGYKITSFAKNRAIINGPSGSRIVFDGEDMVIGGVPFLVDIQRNGIQFETMQGQRILLLFDRSLSSISRSNSSSSSSSDSSSSSSSSSE